MGGASRRDHAPRVSSRLLSTSVPSTSRITAALVDRILEAGFVFVVEGEEVGRLPICHPRPMRADGPALCEAVVDPFEPPMPARVTAKQALHMAEALARGEPNRGRIALTLFRNKINDLRGK